MEVESLPTSEPAAWATRERAVPLVGVLRCSRVTIPARWSHSSRCVLGRADDFEMPRVDAGAVWARRSTLALSTGERPCMAHVVRLHPLGDEDSPVVHQRPMRHHPLPSFVVNLAGVAAQGVSLPVPAVGLLDLAVESHLGSRHPSILLHGVGHVA